MIVAERKAIGDIVRMIEDARRVLVVGCGTCVTVCLAGGEKEVAVCASLLRLHDRNRDGDMTVAETTIERQCEWEFAEQLEDMAADSDAILSLACGAGVQTLVAHFPDTPVLPGLNTQFIGIPEEQGVWTEHCLACGECVLDRTGGICPVARCAKTILNGPCGGSQDGKCEIDPETDCAWQLIFDRLKRLGRLHVLEEIEPPKDWSNSSDGGPRKVKREDMIL